MTYPTIMTIAGSDSGAGAGIQADLKTMAALGCYGTSVITALTAQNGLGVSGIHAPDPGFVVQQLDAVLEGFDIAAAKTGMLFSADIIHGLAERLQDTEFPLVVDPVCVSQSGHQLLEDSAVDSMKERMLPLASILTPNKPEAELLSGVTITDETSLGQAMEVLLDMGPERVLIKGGHFGGESTGLVDWLGRKQDGQLSITALKQHRVDTPNNHGTGCTLSAAMASFLGLGQAVEQAVRSAQAYLNRCLRESYTPGRGFGPPNHMAGLVRAGGSA